ncbi:MAG: hypothetical protein Q8P18_02810 [Pseudomonadota bacterium]|nr:hypothetical protein [Pseudomonadota bacterium]
MIRLSGALLLLLLGCAARPAPASRPPPSLEPTVATPLTPPPARTFDDGPAVADPAAVLTWLDAGRGRRVQLPVVVQFDDQHRLAVTGASIGAGGVPLKLDDTAMGIALIDQLRTLCPPGPACTVWLEGTWGPLMEGMPDFGTDAGPARHDFAVRRVVGLADATATQVRGERP